MPRYAYSSRWTRTVALATAVGAYSISASVWAGELKFSHQELETDDDGKLTAAGREAATNKVESVSADEEYWQVNVWAKVDKGVPGPVYFEFYRNYKGKRLAAHSIEYADYDGGKYLITNLQLARDEGGFTFGETVDVELVQIGANDKQKILAKAKLTFEKGPESAAPEPSAGEEEEEPESDQEAQDELDGLADGSEDPGLAPEPPPIEPESKKGCRVDSGDTDPWGLAVMFALAFVTRRRPRTR
jgi:MYXO-CTERM domain-containing protein